MTPPADDTPYLEADSAAVLRRRADIDAKQAIVGRIIEELGCEAALLLMPTHLAWFTGGVNIRGLTAETERPGAFTNGKQRWLICSNTDTQRLFDEDLDRHGFQLKEWPWASGRAVMLGEIVAGKKVAADRPYPNIVLLNARLRSELRPLFPSDRERLISLGNIVAHAVEATARSIESGETEREVAGHLAHRLYRHGVEALGLSVAADGRNERYRRPGFTDVTVQKSALIQATGTRDGLSVTCSRTVSFGSPSDELRKAHDAACKLAAIYRAFSLAGETTGSAAEAGKTIVSSGNYAFDWREYQPGYGTGWQVAEELRRQGQDEPFINNQAIVWQARLGPAAAIDTMIVTADGPRCPTPCTDWPFKRIKIRDFAHDVPDILER